MIQIGIPGLLFFAMFCINFTLAVTFYVVFTIEGKPKMEINWLIMSVYISSAIWSFGCGMMSIQTNWLPTYIFRYIGILGCFMFMMSVQMVICNLSEIPNKYRYFLNGVSYTGIGIWLLHIITRQTVFVQTSVGTTFYLKPGIVTFIYSLYFTVVCFNIIVVTIYMLRKHKLERVRASAKSFLVVEMLILIGAIFDLLLPVNQIPAIPGSAITQFWGVFVFWFAVHNMYKSQITVTNMSEFIYYSLAIPVLIFDRDYRLQIMNEASAKYLNITNQPEIIREYSVEKLFKTDDSVFDFSDKYAKARAVCFSTNANCELEISKIQDSFNDIIGYIVIVNDLTDHELVIRKLELAKLAADSANMSKSLFLANMSHEIRTPMNAILGFSEIALGEKIDKTSREYFTNIKQSGETLLAIINDILSISKIELGKQELNIADYDPGKIINDVQLIISVQARNKNLDFSVNVDEHLPAKLNGDKDKLREVLINLLNNSVKYTNSGRINLDIQVLEVAGDIASIQFKISDTGIGITEENLPTIFEKFQRVDNSLTSATEGTGLGLAITKGIVDLMQGQINVESIFGVGTTFTVTIPQKVVDSSPYTPVKEDTSETDFSNTSFNTEGIKFLAVDDNRTNLKVISALLKKFGIDHDIASSGQEAIELCKATKYRMILMDQMMPGMDGTEAMKEIRALPNYSDIGNTKIVALTANVVEGAKEELLDSGFDFFIGKPINFRGFERMLKEELG